MRLPKQALCALLPLLFLVPACDTDEGECHDEEAEKDEHNHDHDHGHDEDSDEHSDCGSDPHTVEVISRVELTFTPEGGGDPVVAAFEDADGDGGMSGTFDEIELAPAMTYSLRIKLENTLEEPHEDITAEIEEEAEEHQFLIYGDAVTGPASNGGTLVTHAYADVESDYTENAVGEDLPVGIVNTITTDAEGEGHFSVMLRHLPPLNDNPQKPEGLAESFANGDTLPGDVDVDLEFEIHVHG